MSESGAFSDYIDGVGRCIPINKFCKAILTDPKVLSLYLFGPCLHINISVQLQISKIIYEVHHTIEEDFMSDSRNMSRRDLLKHGGLAAAGMALLPSHVLAQLARLAQDEAAVAWSDDWSPPRNPERPLLHWDELDSWITPVDQFFKASHYPEPEIDMSTYNLEITGAVKKTLSYTLDDIKAMPSKNVDFTLECSGNRGFPVFRGGVYNAKWTGVPLAELLNKSGVLDSGIEVVFFGHDEGEEVMRPRGRPEVTIKQNFARVLTPEQAMHPDVLVCHSVNDQPLPPGHGYPLRLIVPGWYGISQVKWLKRIEVRTVRYMGRFISRDYVTLREELHNGETVWRQTSVGKGQINSVPARVTRVGPTYRIYGAAWGVPIKDVQVRIDDGTWQTAEIIQGKDSPYAWKFWRLDWDRPPSGEHTITSRAVSTGGTVQPAPNDPYLTRKHTYWEANGQVTRKVRTVSG